MATMPVLCLSLLSAALAVADPSRTAEDLKLTLPWRIKSVVKADRGVRRSKGALKVEVAGTRGHARTAVLNV